MSFTSRCCSLPDDALCLTDLTNVCMYVQVHVCFCEQPTLETTIRHTLIYYIGTGCTGVSYIDSIQLANKRYVHSTGVAKGLCRSDVVVVVVVIDVAVVVFRLKILSDLSLRADFLPWPQDARRKNKVQ